VPKGVPRRRRTDEPRWVHPSGRFGRAVWTVVEKVVLPRKDAKRREFRISEN
jgi:hypothetical protein